MKIIRKEYYYVWNITGDTPDEITSPKYCQYIKRTGVYRVFRCGDEYLYINQNELKDKVFDRLDDAEIVFLANLEKLIRRIEKKRDELVDEYNTEIEALRCEFR